MSDRLRDVLEERLRGFSESILESSEKERSEDFNERIYHAIDSGSIADIRVLFAEYSDFLSNASERDLTYGYGSFMEEALKNGHHHVFDYILSVSGWLGKSDPDITTRLKRTVSRHSFRSYDNNHDAENNHYFLTRGLYDLFTKEELADLVSDTLRTNLPMGREGTPAEWRIKLMKVYSKIKW